MKEYKEYKFQILSYNSNCYIIYVYLLFNVTMD